LAGTFAGPCGERKAASGRGWGAAFERREIVRRLAIASATAGSASGPRL